MTVAIRAQKPLVNFPFELETIPWYRNAYLVKNTTTRQLTELPEYKNGEFYIQGLSSMVPALVLDPQPGELILDIAAAPGSKTSQMAIMMQNQGQIIANDISRSRNFALIRNLKTQSITNTQVITSAGQTLWERYTEFFDKTLADVPCSMLQAEADIDKRKVKELAIRQQYLLRSAITATRVGGVIVYSTCTITREENEGVIEKILQKEAGKILLEPIMIPHLNLDTGLIPNTYRIQPSKTMEGFFVTKIRKIASNL